MVHMLTSVGSVDRRTVPFESPEVVCTGRDITPSDYAVVQGNMDRWLAGSNVDAFGSGSYSAEYDNAQLAVCNYGGSVKGDAAEIDYFNYLVDQTCGAYKSGYVWISAWQKTYWRESQDGLVCDNILLTSATPRQTIECDDSGCSPLGWTATAPVIEGKGPSPKNDRKRNTIAKRQPFPSDFQTGCTGSTLNPGHYTSSQSCMYQWFTQRYGVASAIGAFRCDYEDTVLAVCNYGAKGYVWSHDPDEIDQFNGLMDAKCGQWQSGWVYIPEWDKTYWRDTSDKSICTNGDISQISVYCSTDDEYGCVPNKINNGLQGGGQNPPSTWN